MDCENVLCIDCGKGRCIRYKVSVSCNRKRRRCCGGSIRERYSDKPHMKITLEGRLAGVIFFL